MSGTLRESFGSFEFEQKGYRMEDAEFREEYARIDEQVYTARIRKLLESHADNLRKLKEDQ